MNQYLRYIKTYLICVVFGMCCQRGRVYCHTFLKFVNLKFVKERVYYYIFLDLVRGEITEKEGEFAIIEGDYYR